MSEKKSRWYCTTHLDYESNDAGYKAAKDVAEIAERNGATLIPFYSPHFYKNPVLTRISALLSGFQNWLRIARLAKPSEYVLLQHPHEFIRVGNLMISLLKKRGVHFAVLLHDLNDLRYHRNFSASNVDNRLIKQCDKIICLNDTMKQFLAKEGFDEEKMFSMGIWDYLHDCPPAAECSKQKTVAIAGNLLKSKSAYLEHLNELEDITFHLYGPNYCFEDRDSVCYYGQFPPDRLPAELNASFGLVWDGDSLDSCAGNYGEYMMYNNPHKCSLYISAGIPVIVWSKAAIADFVVRNNIGIAVDSLYDVSRKIDTLNDYDYAEMRKCTAEIGKKMRSGWFLTQNLFQMGLIEKRI